MIHKNDKKIMGYPVSRAKMGHLTLIAGGASPAAHAGWRPATGKQREL
jgi:hypothetical protein